MCQNAPLCGNGLKAFSKSFNVYHEDIEILQNEKIPTSKLIFFLRALS